jgi:hypothetical protein
LSRWDKAKAGKPDRAGMQASGEDLAHRFCESSNSFGDIEKRQTPSVPKFRPVIASFFTP